jgi:hypothetical protein
MKIKFPANLRIRPHYLAKLKPIIGKTVIKVLMVLLAVGHQEFKT